MADVITAVASHSDSLRWIFMLALLWAFYRWMQSDNGIAWRDFVAADKGNGEYKGDINRVGQCAGVVGCVFVIIATAPNAHKDYAGFALVLAACLAFLGGVASYAARLRAQQSQTQTTIVTEPVSRQPEKKTVTVTEPAATKETPTPVEIVGGAGVKEPLKVQEQDK